MESLDKIDQRGQCELNIDDLSDIMSDLLKGDNLRTEFNQVLEGIRFQINTKTAEINDLRSKVEQLENEMSELRIMIKDVTNKSVESSTTRESQVSDQSTSLLSSVSPVKDITDKILPPIVDDNQETVDDNQETVDDNQETVDDNQETVDDNQETVDDNQELDVGMRTPPGFIAGTEQQSENIVREESIPTIDSVTHNPNITISDTNTHHNPTSYIPLFPSFNGQMDNLSKGMLYNTDSYWNLHCEINITQSGGGIINFLNGIDNKLSTINIVSFSSSHKGVTTSPEDISVGVLRYTPESEVVTPYMLVVDIQLM